MTDASPCFHLLFLYGYISMKSTFSLLFLFLAGETFAADAVSLPLDLPWAGRGQYRLIVSVDPTPSPRADDLCPAEVNVDFTTLLAELAPAQRADISGLQVIQHALETGQPVPAARLAFATSPLDVEWRWYDNAIAYDFPEVYEAISQTQGKLRWETRPRFGYFYDCLGEWKSGRLGFTHRTSASKAFYGIYFDLLKPQEEPSVTPPRGFLGDGLQRCTPLGESTTGLIHSRVETADWNGDGLFDLLVGCARGGIVWYPNRGDAKQPDFPISKILQTTDGKPVDVGWSAAPHAVDWDQDGTLDLLVGAEWNRLLFYRNLGNNAAPALEYAGPVCTQDGEVLSLPIAPIPESPEGVFQRDYYPVVETIDWDGDDDLDLLAGGYVTGRVFLFENVGHPQERPTLQPRGPLWADGKALDVGWCAAPCLSDFDNDGDVDLVSGCMVVTDTGGDSLSSKQFLHYFRNDGTPAEPRLTRQEFPCQGSFPQSALGTPSAVDWNGDGLLDLVVSAATNIYLFKNIGTKQTPLFEAHVDPLPSRWGSSSLPIVQMLDWNQDGFLDGLQGTTLYLNQGEGSPGVFARATSLLPPGETISHLSGIGDDWQFQRIFDLDQDGQLDLMDADHGGHIWWHRNRGTSTKPDFEPTGIRLQQQQGDPIRVGLDREGFDALQGARAAYTVGDFENDGLYDLVVTDTFGFVRYYRQVTPVPDAPPVFAKPLQIGKLSSRCIPFAADWNQDGNLDVVVGSRPEDVQVFLGGQEPTSENPFAAAQPIPLPSAPYGAGAPLVVADFNGDGDDDLIVNTAYGYTCLYERSFIENGYASGQVLKVERRPRP